MQMHSPGFVVILGGETDLKIPNREEDTQGSMLVSLIASLQIPQCPWYSWTQVLGSAKPTLHSDGRAFRGLVLQQCWCQDVGEEVEEDFEEYE